MALRDQPYLPLYVQDLLTDENLIECSAESHGVYFRLLCHLHKEKYYGKVLLKQKYKQTSSTVKNFALMFALKMPFSVEIIERSLSELLGEDVIQIEDNWLFQKRMVKDGEVSLARSKAGKVGGEANKKNLKICLSKKASKSTSKSEANSENENEYVIEYEIESLIFNNWNKNNVIKHKELTADIIQAIQLTLKTFSLDQILEAIKNYGTVVNSDLHYFKHRWTIEEFLKGGGKDRIKFGNLKRFLSESKPLENFKEQNGKTSKTSAYHRTTAEAGKYDHIGS